MKKFRFPLILAALLLLNAVSASSQSRRPIDSRHPMWLIHIDVWNTADPQRIIDLIPADVKPFVCFNLSLSCQYDTERNVYKMPQNAVLTYKSWASVCCANNVWFTCQPASGGHTHIMDDDLDTFEYFFKHYKNFLGWNYAEQFWGFDEPGDKSSSTQSSRWELFANLVEMSHKYGGTLIVSFCGNIWSHPLNPNGIVKRNAKLLANCQKYPDAFLILYKYTTSSCFYNNESVCLAPFISGLARNYGVRYDNCGWNGALDELLGENHGKKYPIAAGIGTVMEQTCINGGAVWDGPELIWTEDFQELSRSTTSDGYTRRNWGRFPGFDNAWLDMFRKIIDGTMYIPTREEVIARNKVVIINNATSGSDQEMYAAPDDLYDGLYKQNDPMNRGNGRWMDNMTYFKSTGRYQAIPVVAGLYDSLAQTIPVQVKRSSYPSRWGTQTKKVTEFNKLYPAVSSGDLYVARHHNGLVTYFPFSYFNKKKSASARIPLEYNTCDSLLLTYGKLGSGIVREYEDHIDFYLNNYRTDTVTQVTDRIVIKGAAAAPSHQFKLRSGAKGSAEPLWDETSGTYTIEVKHMGPVELSVSCGGSAVGRRTDILDSEALTDLPVQPEEYYGDLIIEAEDMEYKNISSCCTNPYSSYPNVRGHAANGFVVTGTNTAGSLRRSVNISHPGTYTVSVRYMNNGQSGRVYLRVNSYSKTIYTEKTAMNEWKTISCDFEMNEGSNTIALANTGGTNMYIDQVVCSPLDKHTLVYDKASHPDDENIWLESGDYRMDISATSVEGCAGYVVEIYDAQTQDMVFKSERLPMGEYDSEGIASKVLFTIDKPGEYRYVTAATRLWDGVMVKKCTINRTFLYNVRLQQSDGGVITASQTLVEEGDPVTLSAETSYGFSFEDWNVIHGGISIVNDAFVMPGNDVTIGAILKDNSLVWQLDYSNVLAGTFPAGWRAVQGGNEVHSYPNSYGSGARTMSGFKGWQGKALYWRESLADYGRQSGYYLNLKPGMYKLTFVMAAWKGSPSYRARILKSSGTSVATSSTYPATPNANGNTGASIASSPVRELTFEIKEEGRYIIEFRNAGSGFDEFLLAECRLNRAEDTGVIQPALEDGAETVFSPDGVETGTLRPGINIVRSQDGTVSKVLVK